MPETRSCAAREEVPLSEAEIEQLARQVKDREAQLREQSKLLFDQSEALRAKENALEAKFKEIEASANNPRFELMQLEIERLQKQLKLRDEAVEHSVGAQGSPSSLEESKIEATQRTPNNLENELVYLRQEVQSLKSRNNSYFQQTTIEHRPSSYLLQEIVANVPIFDGYNIPVLQFTRACCKALARVSPSCERELVPLLINRLRGNGYDAIEDERIETVVDLTDALKRNFCIFHSADVYRGELCQIYKLPDEPILEYINRVKDLRMAILDAERQKFVSLPPAKEKEIDELTINSFCLGLPLNYNLATSAKFFTTPKEAYDEAKTIAHLIEREKQRNSEFYAGKRNNKIENTGFPKNSSAPTNGTVLLPSDRGPTYGSNKTNQVGNGTGNRDLGAVPRISCRYCKKPGHLVENCRTLQYRKQNQGNGQGFSRQNDAGREAPSPSRRVNLVHSEEEPSESQQCN